MSNIVRHAGAGRVEVVLDVDDDIALTVRDDGAGLAAGRAGNGLRNIRQRAELLGGSCDVISEPGSGTTVTWTAPRKAS